MEIMEVGVSSWDKALAVSSIVTASLFVLVLLFQVRATEAARKAAKAATHASEAAGASVVEAKRSNDMVLQEQSIRIRPWIAIGFPFLHHVSDESRKIKAIQNQETGIIKVPKTVGDNWNFSYKIPVTNYGEYPATALSLRTKVEFDLDKVEAGVQSSFDLGYSLLVPKQTEFLTLDLSTHVYKRFDRSGESFYVGVSARYLDRESNEWLVDAVYKLSASGVTTVRHSLPREIPSTTRAAAERTSDPQDSKT